MALKAHEAIPAGYYIIAKPRAPLTNYVIFDQSENRTTRICLGLLQSHKVIGLYKIVYLNITMT